MFLNCNKTQKYSSAKYLNCIIDDFDLQGNDEKQILTAERLCLCKSGEDYYDVVVVEKLKIDGETGRMKKVPVWYAYAIDYTLWGKSAWYRKH